VGVVLRLSCATVMLASPLAVWAQTPGSAELDPTAPLDPMPDIGVEWPDMNAPDATVPPTGDVETPAPAVTIKHVPTGGLMPNYIDAIVIPVPRAKLDTYKRMSEVWGRAHLRHGALYFHDSISDDAQPGKVTSFPQAVQLKDETKWQ